MPRKSSGFAAAAGGGDRLDEERGGAGADERLALHAKDINIRLPVGGPCFVLGVFLALRGSSSLRSRWVGGHRVFYVVPTAAVHVAVCITLGKL